MQANTYFSPTCLLFQFCCESQTLLLIIFSEYCQEFSLIFRNNTSSGSRFDRRSVYFRSFSNQFQDSDWDRPEEEAAWAHL